MKVKFNFKKHFEKHDWIIAIIPTLGIAYRKQYNEFRIVLLILCFELEIEFKLNK